MPKTDAKIAKDAEKAAPAPFESRMIGVSGGVELYVCEYGDEAPSAAPLFVVHETGGSREALDPLVEALLPYYRVYAYDLRGHGKSTGDFASATYQTHAADLFSLLNTMQIGQAVIVGVSDGGAIALQLASDHQERVAALVTISTPLSINGLTTSGKLSSSIEKRVGGLLSSASGKGKRAKDMPSTLVGKCEVAISPLSRVLADTLVVTGDNDPVKREHSKAIQTTMPNAELRFVDGGGRDILAENTAEVVELVRHWLVEEG